MGDGDEETQDREKWRGRRTAEVDADAQDSGRQANSGRVLGVG